MTNAQTGTLLDLLSESDTPALRVTRGGTRFSYRELRREVWAVAEQLAKTGVKHGDVVALCFPNTLELVMSFIAVTWLGAVNVPLNPKSTARDSRFLLENVRASWVLVPENGNVTAEGVAGELKLPVLSVNEKAGTCLIKCKTSCNTAEAPAERPKPDDVALILYTSGTTGEPKGVPLRHSNMMSTIRNIGQTYKLRPSDKGYLVMPLFHVHGLMAALLAPLFAGGEIVLPADGAGFLAGSFWDDVATHKVTWYTAVPTMHQALLSRSAEFQSAESPKLRFIRSCSSSLPPPLLLQLERLFGAPVLEAYAMTEGCHQITSNPLPEDGVHKPGSVGRGVNVEVKIVDANFDGVGAGVQGEVCIRGPSVCSGYLRRPEATQKLFTPDGFLRTGDEGYLDEEGYLFLTARIKEHINRGGEKIAPVPIDNVLITCPGVAEISAFAVKHAELGETVAVAVVPQPGASVTLRQLNRHALDSGHLKMEWFPECLVYCDRIPLGPTGKVQRVEMAHTLGMPTLTETPITFRHTPKGLQRVVTDAVTKNKVGLPFLTELVGASLGVELTECSAELTLDSFTAVRLSRELMNKVSVCVSPKVLVAGTTLNQLWELANKQGREVAPKYCTELQCWQRAPCVTHQPSVDSVARWEAESTVPPHLQEVLQRAAQTAGNGAGGQDVLLTGATGFLGAHLVSALLKHNPGRVLCVVRSKNVKEGLERIEAHMKEQKVWDENHRSRIEVLLGDVTQKGYGLEFKQLLSCGILIHNAAFVNHALPFEDLRQANVESTIHGLELCALLTTTTGKVCHFTYISTGGVCGRRSFSNEPQPLRLENPSRSNGYVQTKWVAERLIEKAALLFHSYRKPASSGPPHFSICRPGAITGHRQTGVSNLGDSINRYLIGFVLLDCAPPLPPVQVDMSPVDWVAGAVAGLSLQDAGLLPSASADLPPSSNNTCPIYTLDNGMSLRYAELLNHLHLSPTSSYADFVHKLEFVKNEQGKHDQTNKTDEKNEIEHTHFPNPLLGLFGALRSSPPLFGCTASRAHMNLLEKRGFPSPPMTLDLLRIYFTYFVDAGALPASVLDRFQK